MSNKVVLQGEIRVRLQKKSGKVMLGKQKSNFVYTLATGQMVVPFTEVGNAGEKDS